MVNINHFVGNVETSATWDFHITNANTDFSDYVDDRRLLRHAWCVGDVIIKVVGPFLCDSSSYSLDLFCRELYLLFIKILF